MHDLFVISFRTVLLYVIILVVLRIMGKREVGELGVIDIVVFIIIAEIAAFSLDSPDKKLIEVIVPIMILLVIQLLTSFISLKSKSFRDVVDGDPSVLIRNGQVMEKEMRKQRYNLDDLFQQLREEGIGSVREVTFAFLEPSGNLSVFKKGETQPVLALISDGVIQMRHLEIIGKTDEWLINELRRKGVDKYEQVFYCTFEGEELKFQLREKYQ